jgi:hypothetical protein
MSAGARVLAGVLVGRAVAASRGSAFLAGTKVHPPRAGLDAVLAFPTRRWLDGGDGPNMGAGVGRSHG